MLPSGTLMTKRALSSALADWAEEASRPSVRVPPAVPVRAAQ